MTERRGQMPHTFALHQVAALPKLMHTERANAEYMAAEQAGTELPT